MHDIWRRAAEHFSERVDGPLHFRLVLQPLMAVIFATIGGFKDAKAGRAPYLWRLCSEPQNRGVLLLDGWKSIGKVFILAVVLDVVFQIEELQTVYPSETLMVAILLAIVPYLLVRGPVTRLLSRPKHTASDA
jgi:hypothetical protein